MGCELECLWEIESLEHSMVDLLAAVLEQVLVATLEYRQQRLMMAMVLAPMLAEGLERSLTPHSLMMF